MQAQLTEKSPIETASAKYPISRMGTNRLHNLNGPESLPATASINTKSLNCEKAEGVVTPPAGDVNQHKVKLISRDSRRNKSTLLGSTTGVEQMIRKHKKKQDVENELWKKLVSFKKRDYGRTWRSVATDKHPYGKLHTGVRPMNQCKVELKIQQKRSRQSRAEQKIEKFAEKCRQNSLSPVKMFDVISETTTSRGFGKKKKKYIPNVRRMARGKHIAIFTIENKDGELSRKEKMMSRFHKQMDMKDITREKRKVEQQLKYLEKMKKRDAKRSVEDLCDTFSNLKTQSRDFGDPWSPDRDRVAGFFDPWEPEVDLDTMLMNSVAVEMAQRSLDRYFAPEARDVYEVMAFYSYFIDWRNKMLPVFEDIRNREQMHPQASYDSPSSVLIEILTAKIKEKNDWMPPLDMITHIERLVESIFLITQASSWSVGLLQLKVYICSLTNTGVATHVYRFIKNIWDSELSTQAFSDWGQSVRELFTTVKAARHGDFWNKMVKTIACVVSLGMCSLASIPFGTQQFAKWYATSGFGEKHWFDLTTCILDTIEYVYDKGLGVYKGTCSMRDFFSGKTVSEYEATYAKIVGGIVLYEQDKLDKIGLDEHSYSAALSDLIHQTRELHSISSGVEKRVFAVKMVELQRINARCMMCIKNFRLRKCPFTYMMHGGSGVGKTTIAGQLLHYVLKRNNLPSDDRYIAYINMQDKYQSDIRSEHVAYRLDDYGNTKPEFEETPSSIAVVNYANNEPKMCLKADLDSKGSVPIRPMVICGTTNVKELNAAMTSCEPLSILRRFQLFIEVEVKEEYRAPNSTFIRKDIFDGDNDIKDFWYFTVEEAYGLPRKNASGATAHDFRVLSDDDGPMYKIGMERLIAYMGKVSIQHFKQQTLLLETSSRISKLELCDHDSFKDICHLCNNKPKEVDRTTLATEEELSQVLSAEQVEAIMAKRNEYQLQADFSSSTHGSERSRDWNTTMEGGLEREITQSEWDSLEDNCIDVNEWLLSDYNKLAKLDAFTTWLSEKWPENLTTRGWLGLPYRLAKIRMLQYGFTCISDLAWHHKEGLVIVIIMLMKTVISWKTMIALLPVYVIAILLIYMVARTYIVAVKTELVATEIADKGLDVYGKVIRHKYDIMMGFGAVVTLLTLVKFLRLNKKVIQEFYVPQGNANILPVVETKPVVVEQVTDKENVWLVPEIEPIQAPIRVSTCTVPQMIQVVEKQCGRALFTFSDRPPAGCNIFPYKGNCWILPFHVMRKNPVTIQVTRKNGSLTNSRTCKIGLDSWRRVGKTDLALVCLASMGDVKDFSEFFLDKQPNTIQVVHMIHKKGDTSVEKDTFVAKPARVMLPDKEYDDTYTYDGWHYETNNVITQDGMCMSPLISEGPRPFIMGFHSAGVDDSKRGAGHFITKDELAVTYTQLFASQRHTGLNVQCHSSGNIVLNYPKYGFDFKPELHKKHPLNWLENDGCVLIYGGHNKLRRFDSDVCPTYISPYVEELMGLEIKHAKPVGMNSYHPWRTWLSAAIDVNECDPLILGFAHNDLRKKISGIALKYSEEVKKIRILSNDEILAGRDGVYAIDAMKLRTSSGFPRCKMKKEIISLSEREVDGISCPLDLEQEVWDEVERMENILATGERVHVVHRLNLKDEPTKVGKKKVRVFAGCSIEMLILVRKYFSFVMKFVVEHGLEFETAVGINAFSTEWTGLYNYVTSKSEENSCNGDFKEFDIRTQAHMNMLAFDLLTMICSEAGFDERSLIIMRGIATELSFGLVEIVGAFIQVFGVTLSGHGATIIINNLNNSTYVRYAFFDVAYAMLKGNWSWFDGMDPDILGLYLPTWKRDFAKKGAPETFDEVVAFIAYGDDNQWSVSNGYSWFNHTTMAHSLGKVGVTYTMADKEAKSVPYIHAKQCSFLKRAYRWDDDVEEYKAPLELMSLQKTLHACLKSKVLTPKMQSREAILSVMRELYQHGETVFSEWREGLLRVIDAAGISGYFEGCTLPTYDYYHNDYIERYKSKPPKSIGGYVETGIMLFDSSSEEESTPAYMSEAFNMINTNGVGCMRVDSLSCQSKDEVTDNIQNNYDISTVTGGTHQTTVFRDGTPQWATGIPGAYDETRKIGMKDNMSLDDFFRRPVEYTLPEWTPGSASPYTAVFNPWSVYWGNKRNINRITNNQLLQCELHMKIMINGNGFYFGRLMADYVPLFVFNNADQTNTLNVNNIMQASQRLHLYINPTTSQGGEMMMPFIWPYTALRIPQADWTSMGVINIREINSLKHANAATTPITISCYIWAENVEFSVPTTIGSSSLVPQAKDEYGSKPISNMATTVAAAMNGMSNVPVIGPYAKATSMVAGGLGSVAKMFGYSRAPQIEDSTMVRPHIVSRLANTDCGDAVAKLTVDSKQELTIDNRVFGADTEDQLVIKNIAKIESYLTTFNWVVGTAKDTHLWNMRITPSQGNLDSTLTNPAYNLTAMGFAALPFFWWRGTMRVRFQVVCSEYHRGRLRVVYDPQYVGSLESNVAYTRIVDLVNEKEFTMDISWAQDRAFLPVANLTSVTGWRSTTAFVTGSGFANGVLGVYVQNDLTTPNSTANNDIQINVFVSMCEDFDVAAPHATNINSLSYSTQSADYTTQADETVIDSDENAPAQTTVDNKVLDCLPVDHTADVHFGERITSFRTLLRRYNYVHSLFCPTPGDNMWSLQIANFPYYRGRFQYAINTDSTAALSNFTNNTLINYLTPAFLGVRGGMRWKYIYGSDKDSNLAYAAIDRANTDTALAYSNTASVPVSTNVNTYAVSRLANKDNMLTGAEITYLKAQPVIEVELPYYSVSRFMLAKDIKQTNVTGTQAPNHRLMIDNHSTAVSYLDRYVATGEDFTLFLFQGAPPMRVITLAAT